MRNSGKVAATQYDKNPLPHSGEKIQGKLAEIPEVSEHNLEQVGIQAQVPVTVQVPVGIAANVCNVDANVLAQQAKTGTATCTAENVTQGFIQQANRNRGSQTN